MKVIYLITALEISVVVTSLKKNLFKTSPYLMLHHVVSLL